MYDVAVETPVESARGLSTRLGNNILIKREDLQPVFSFKIKLCNCCKRSKVFKFFKFIIVFNVLNVFYKENYSCIVFTAF